MPQIRQTERRLKVLDLLRKGETETSIAPKLEVSRETIVRDVRWLKQNLAYDFTLITNEIMQKLHERIDKMTNYELISFLGKLYVPPHKMEVKEEIKIEEKKIEILADYTGAIEAAAKRDTEAFRVRKQVDSTES